LVQLDALLVPMSRSIYHLLILICSFLVSFCGEPRVEYDFFSKETLAIDKESTSSSFSLVKIGEADSASFDALILELDTAKIAVFDLELNRYLGTALANQIDTEIISSTQLTRPPLFSSKKRNGIIQLDSSNKIDSLSQNVFLSGVFNNEQGPVLWYVAGNVDILEKPFMSQAGDQVLTQRSFSFTAMPKSFDILLADFGDLKSIALDRFKAKGIDNSGNPWYIDTSPASLNSKLVIKDNRFLSLVIEGPAPPSKITVTYSSSPITKADPQNLPAINLNEFRPSIAKDRIQEILPKDHDSESAGQTKAVEGRQILAKFACLVCHSIEKDGENKQGPSFYGLVGSTRILSDSSTVVADQQYILSSIFEPASQVVSGYSVGMASYRGLISDQEAQAIYKYISDLE